jgi:hypothetical protein
VTDAAGTQDAAGAEQAAQRAVARARAAVRGGRGPGAGAAEVLRQRHRDDFRMATVGRGPVGHHAGVGGSSRAQEVPALDADLAHVAALADVHALLLHTGRRRLAVVDGAGRLLGLLCLTRRRTGYCSDAGVAERARSRRCAPEAPAPTR